MSSLELVAPETLVDVRTGEVVPATPEKAVELLGAVRELRARMLGLVKDCEAVLLEESRRQGTKTLRFPEGTATVTGGRELDWDLEVLAGLRGKGLPEDRFDELVVATVTYKVNAAVAKQLESANPEYAEIISRSRNYVEKPWRVSLR